MPRAGSISNDMGWLTGLEPATSGATIRCLTPLFLDSEASAPSQDYHIGCVYTDLLHRLSWATALPSEQNIPPGEVKPLSLSQ